MPKQMKKRFGSQGSYLVDFYHVCEYLSAAAQGIEAQLAAQKAWVDEQKQRLKTSQVNAVIQALHAHLEPQGQADEASPVRRCQRYLLGRLDQRRAARRLAHRFRRNRKRPPLCRTKAPEAARRLVGGIKR
jgi:hypothetical protein